MSSAPIQIINPNFETKRFDFVDGSNYVKCNHSKDVEHHIYLGKKYLFEFPESNRFVNVVCTFKAMRACDMKIISTFVDGIKVDDDEEYTFSYCYDDFYKIHFTSFSYKEPCVLYMSLN
jgi:hypothetical protein